MNDMVACYVEDDGAHTSVLDDLEADPSWQNLSDKISALAGIQNSARWAIGEIMLFWRYRAAYSPIAEFDWAGGEWPPELFEFLKQRTGRTLSVQDAEIVEFVAWHTYRFHEAALWLLVPLGGKGKIKVWQKGHVEIDESEFEGFIRQVGGALKEILDENTLLAYYYTAACYPRSERVLDASWTAHYRLTNVAGNEVDDTLRGFQRLEAKAPIAQKMLKELSKEGKQVTLAKIRALEAKVTNEKRGWEWLLPPVSHLYVKNGDGNVYMALEFNVEVETEEAIQAVIYAAGLTKTYCHVEDGLLWNDSGYPATLFLQDGTLVATCPCPEEPAVANALAALAIKMRWKVER